MIKKLFSISLFALLGITLYAQSGVQHEIGVISYVTSQSVYVKFSSTENLQVGDTLFVDDSGNPLPVLKVMNMSSISCVCSSLSSRKLAVSDEVYFLSPMKNEIVEEAAIISENQAEIIDSNTVGNSTSDENKSKESIKGRLSTSAYFINSNQAPDYSLRMRYAFKLDAQHINDSKVSVESYFLFSHKNKQWDLIKNDIFNGLKIYNLAVNYEFSEQTQLWLGRRINYKLSSVGAIDGAQFEKTFGAYTAGLVVGSRPDWQNYSYNPNLFQIGGYLSHDYLSEDGKGMQSTIALMEQENNWNSDRRFLYFQHSNWLLKNLFFFGSGEFDLFKNVGGVKENTFRLTNLYASVRYQVYKPLRLTLSYHTRNNIIYYQTNKDIIDQLLDNKKFEGLSLSANYRLFKKILIGSRGSYRFRDGDPRGTRNLYSYLTYSRVPFLGVSASIYNSLVETSYIKSIMYGIRMNRDIIRGKLYGGLNYRYANYSFYSAKSSAIRHTAQLSLNYKIFKNLSSSVNYELSMEGKRNYNYVYFNITQRF